MKTLLVRFVLLAFLLSAPLPLAVAQDAPFFSGDHVVYIGNTLADRMQHHGWLESYVHALMPGSELTFRNLGFSGDELTLRQRADNFGDANQWLTKCKADVIFCFFGYNEALKGEAGLAKFKTDLGNLIDEMRSQQYNGSTAPRITMFSPIAHEDLKSPHLPDGKANNKNLAMYTNAMQTICDEKNVPFVDLFTMSESLYKQHDEPLTMNGIHLLDRGNRLLAREIVKLAAPDVDLPSDDAIKKVRDAVLDKNNHWFSRYRVVDEYNVFGGRSKLQWFGQSNADVMMREMEIFDVKTANRDKHIWAIAEGKESTVDDSNLPEEVPVRPNRQGPLEFGAFPYLSGEAGIEKMEVHEGFEVNLFASEEKFPRLINPVQMAVDTDSRLWASVWPSYPHWNPTQPRRDALVILPDEDGDGKADELKVFADELNSITGFEFWGGGVLVAAPPEIWFLKDTDGDDKADVKIRILQGVSSADTHHSANAMVIGPDGWLYWSRGIFNVAAFETPTRTHRTGKSGVHRFNPRTYEIEFHYPIGPNPHGDVIDRWGYQFANDGTSGTGGYVSIGKGQRPGGRQWFKKEWRPVAATGILSSSHFPTANQNNFLICNCIGFRGVLQYNVEYDGAEIKATRTQDLLSSSDENFRPSDIEIGGDGAIYVADWHNVLIGHMQHNMREPNRDHEHGRIYRVTAKGRDLVQPAKMKGKPIVNVLQNFFAKENSVRYRARLELSGRNSDATIAAVNAFTASLDPANDSVDRDESQALLECLWVHEEHRVPNMKLLKRVFAAREPKVRAAAVRTMGHWAGRIDGWEDTLSKAARDESALVRAEAVKAAIEFPGLAAAEAIFEVANRKTDPELDGVLTFARKNINVDSMIADAVKNGQKLSPAARTYALQRADASLLLRMEKSPEVYEVLLSRKGVKAQDRWTAINAIATANGRSSSQQLIASISDAERKELESLGDLAGMLGTVKKAELSGLRSELEQLVANSKSSDARVAGYAAWFDSGDVPNAWRHAMGARDRLGDALTGISKMRDPAAKGMVVSRVRPLMFELPQSLKPQGDSAASQSGPPVSYEYYEPNAGDVANETLDGLKPKLTGILEDFETFVPGGVQDGFATRQTASISVMSPGRYTFYTRSDDGSRLYINDKQVVNNDGLHGQTEKSGRIRLAAGTHKIVVTYFDNGGADGLTVSWKGPGFKKQRIPASALKTPGSGNLRRRALRVMAASESDLPNRIDDFAKLVADESLSDDALSALAALPTRKVADRLAKSQSGSILEKIFTQTDKATPVERQSIGFSNLLALGDSLLVKNASNAARLQLNKLKASIPVKADPNVMALGKEVYSRESHCATCHQSHGQGLPNLYPPLDGSIWATGSEDRMIRMVLDGMHGTIEVNGKTYSSPPLPPMTGFRHLLDDTEIAAVLTYVRNSWSNRAKPVDSTTVATVRAIDRGADAAFWSATDLLAQFPLEDGSSNVAQTSSDGWVPKLVKEWKAADFESNPVSIKGNSYENGKLAFKRVGCAQCHKLGEIGGVFGPSLAELDIKKKNANYVLQSILDPSKDIEPKYAMKTYYLESGKVVTGMIVKETADEVQLVADPLNQVTPTIVKKSDIEEESQAASSVMPQGLLNWLDRQGINDLITFVLAGGDENSPLYK